MYLGFKFLPVKEKLSAMAAPSVRSPAGIDCIKDWDRAPPKTATRTRQGKKSGPDILGNRSVGFTPLNQQLNRAPAKIVLTASEIFFMILVLSTNGATKDP